MCLEVEPLNIKTANRGLWKSAIVGISYLSFLFMGRTNMKVEKNELWFARAPHRTHTLANEHIYGTNRQTDRHNDFNIQNIHTQPPKHKITSIHTVTQISACTCTDTDKHTNNITCILRQSHSASCLTKSRPPTAPASQHIRRASDWEQKFTSSANLGEASVKKTKEKNIKEEEKITR